MKQMLDIFSTKAVMYFINEDCGSKVNIWFCISLLSLIVIVSSNTLDEIFFI